MHIHVSRPYSGFYFNKIYFPTISQCSHQIIKSISLFGKKSEIFRVLHKMIPKGMNLRENSRSFYGIKRYK